MTFKLTPTHLFGATVAVTTVVLGGALATVIPMTSSASHANDAAIARAIGVCLYKSGRADQATIVAATTTWLKAQGADPRLAWERATPEIIARADYIQSRLGPDCKSLPDA